MVGLRLSCRRPANNIHPHIHQDAIIVADFMLIGVGHTRIGDDTTKAVNCDAMKPWNVVTSQIHSNAYC